MRAYSPSHYKSRGSLYSIRLRSYRSLALVCLGVLVLLSVHFFLVPIKHTSYKKHRASVPARTPTRYHGHVPILDREKLAEVEARERYRAQLEFGDDDFEEWIVPPNPDSPPVVTGVPQSKIKHKPVIEELWPDTKADQQFCNDSSTCRVLLPIWIGEQESKATRHLHQLGLLAKHLNRTLILPPMWKARFGTCHRNPFDYYYDQHALSNLGIVTGSFASFQRWTSHRFNRPTARIMELQPHAIPYPSAQILAHSTVDYLLKTVSRGKRNHCLQDKTPRIFFQALPMTLRPLVPRWFSDRNETSGFATDVLSIFKAQDHNILAVIWELRQPIFPTPADVYIEYSPRWRNLAHSVAKTLSPFIAVHWRMETIPSGNMAKCATGLISTLVSLVNMQSSFISSEGTEHKPLTTVYLATDYPLEGPSATPHSGTFHSVNDDHHTAIRTLRRAFAPDGLLSSVRLTSLADQNTREWDRGGVGPGSVDQGLAGIIDKNIAMRADLFVAGTQDCSRQSSFTAQIISTRSQNLMHSRVTGMWNVVDYFGVGEQG